MKKMMSTLCTVFMVVGIASSSYALLITPETDPRWVGNETSQAAIDAIIGPIMGYAPELYKQNVGEASDTGPFASSYRTTFNPLENPEDADIVYVGGPAISGSSIYLLVKDGRQQPAWYLFDLGDFPGLSWDGTETIQLRGFWPEQGAISHVAIYGITGVPEPITMLLLGFGLVGLAGIGRLGK